MDGYVEEGYGGELKACDTAQIQQASPLNNLKQRKQNYEQKLAVVNEAIAALEANPEIERVLTLVTRAGR